MWSSITERTAIRFYWELKDKLGYFWNGRLKKAVTDPEKRSEYRSKESAIKYHPQRNGSADMWVLREYTVWSETIEYSSEKSRVVS